MESETGTLGHADSASRYCPQQQRAGRVAGAVNDNVLVGIPELSELLQIFVDPTPWIILNPNRGPSGVDTR